MTERVRTIEDMDSLTRELVEKLFQPGEKTVQPDHETRQRMDTALREATSSGLTGPIIQFFADLQDLHSRALTPESLGFTRETLLELARKHAAIDEHGVTVGGRLGRALPIVAEADLRVKEYMAAKDADAPSGIQLWETVQENMVRIKRVLNMSKSDWETFSGQLKHAVDSVETLAKILDLPETAIREVGKVTRHYRMRLTPYYASLIVPGRINDPILLQSVPTGEMIDNAGIEIPPVAADHSPARLIDQFYPRVLTIKATNMCAMYCTHCLRIAHIGKKDLLYSREAYGEALDYIRGNTLIRDVLVTGGDAFILPNQIIRWLLGELDAIDHVTTKRLGSRIPVTCPQRIDPELLDILEESNDQKPVRVVTQINTAQEITPVSRDAFKSVSKRVSAVLNQAVLLRGINDSRVKMWKLCETIHEAYVRPYYVFNCSYRNPQFAHLRVPVEKGMDILESMYGNISGDAIPRYIATAGGKIPLHRSNVVGHRDGQIVLRKPWNGEEVLYPDADPDGYEEAGFAFARLL